MESVLSLWWLTNVSYCVLHKWGSEVGGGVSHMDCSTAQFSLNICRHNYLLHNRKRTWLEFKRRVSESLMKCSNKWTIWRTSHHYVKCACYLRSFIVRHIKVKFPNSEMGDWSPFMLYLLIVQHIITTLLGNTVVVWAIFEPYLFIWEMFTHVEVTPTAAEVLQI